MDRDGALPEFEPDDEGRGDQDEHAIAPVGFCGGRRERAADELDEGLGDRLNDDLDKFAHGGDSRLLLGSVPL